MSPLSDFENFEWQIQDGGKKWKNAIILVKSGTVLRQYGGQKVKNYDRLGENGYRVVFDVADYKFLIRFPRFKKLYYRYLNRICEILVKLQKIIASGISGLPDTVVVDEKMMIKKN